MSDDGFAHSPADHATDAETQAYQAFVINQLKAGSTPGEISGMLTEQGMGKAQAGHLVESTQALLIQLAEAERVDGRGIVLGLLGGAMAAALGAAVWAYVTLASESEFGFIAWGIGGLCGFAVALFARPRRGTPLQLIAVICSVLGILLGKYGWVYLLVSEQAGGEEISFFSPDLISFFFGQAGEWLSGFDLLWIGLAVITAWGIPKAGGFGALTGNKTPGPQTKTGWEE